MLVQRCELVPTRAGGFKAKSQHTLGPSCSQSVLSYSDSLVTLWPLPVHWNHVSVTSGTIQPNEPLYKVPNSRYSVMKQKQSNTGFEENGRLPDLAVGVETGLLVQLAGNSAKCPPIILNMLSGPLNHYCLQHPELPVSITACLFDQTLNSSHL